MKELLNILLSDRPLLITADGYRQAAITALPYMRPTDSVKVVQGDDIMSLMGEKPTYKEVTARKAAVINAMLHESRQTEEICLTSEFLSDELPNDSVAYHRVEGFITGNSRWLFSSKQLELDLQAAEASPQICAHFIHVNSAGGEAWYMDRLSETLRSLQKPVLTLCEGCMCSAAYYIGCHGQKVYTLTSADFIGSIGTMLSFYDFSQWYEQMGIRLIEAKADQSDLKNKMADDLCDGKPRQYIEEVLNPINDRFLSEVRAMRKALAAMDKDHPVLRGEVYLTDRALEVGLIDGQRTLVEAVLELKGMADTRREIDYILDNI